MSHPNKVKGSRWESAVRDFLRGHWREIGAESEDAIERTGAVYGKDDRGDIRGVPGFVIECKDEQSIDLPGYLREAALEKVNAGARWAAVIVKARRQPVPDAYVVMKLDQFVELLAELECLAHPG